ncbi:hypothetical protein [Rhodopila sp.]
MGDDPASERVGIEVLLARIENIILQGELPSNLAGNLMSRSLEEFYDKL